MADVTTLIAQLATQARGLIGVGADDVRKGLIQTVNKLHLALETPSETVLRMTWAQRGLDLSIQTAVAMKLFNALSDTEPRTSKELGMATSGDPTFVSRLLKHMAGMDIINETSSDHYTHTKLSKALAQPIYADSTLR